MAKNNVYLTFHSGLLFREHPAEIMISFGDRREVGSDRRCGEAKGAGGGAERRQRTWHAALQPVREPDAQLILGVMEG